MHYDVERHELFTELRSVLHTDLHSDTSALYGCTNSARQHSARLHSARLHSARLHSARLHSARLHSARLHSALLLNARLLSARLISACPETHEEQSRRR